MTIRRLIPNDILIPQIAQNLQQGKTVVLSVRGVSMRPFLEHERDSVILCKPPHTLHVGDVVLASVAPHQYVLHRIIRITDQTLVLRGDGNLQQREVCTQQDVLGIMVGMLRKGAKQPLLTTSRYWRYYSYLWMHTLPVRRILLYLDRRLCKPTY